MADKAVYKTVDELGEGFEVSNDIPDEVLEGIAGGRQKSECKCPYCGNTEEAYLSGPPGPNSVMRLCTKCGICYPLWV